MIPKLWSLLMLKLSRLIVAVENAFRKKEPTSPEEIARKELCKTMAMLRKRRKAVCESHDYCEECNEYYDCEKGCIVADDNEGVPCYWEVDE